MHNYIPYNQLLQTHVHHKQQSDDKRHYMVQKSDGKGSSFSDMHIKNSTMSVNTFSSDSNQYWNLQKHDTQRKQRHT